MDQQKYVMLKVSVMNKEYITLGIIKDEFNVESEEALDMLNNLVMEGMVEPFAADGTHFKVKK